MPSNRFRILLISTYELGHQPFGLASPAAWLREAGFEVTCCDLSVEPLPRDAVKQADLTAFYVPMHTATRLAVQLVDRVREYNSSSPIAFYGLYAPMNAALLTQLGAVAVLGGEFESALVQLARRLERHQTGLETAPVEPVVSTDRLDFKVPDREGLPALKSYAYLVDGDGERKTVGYVEATRGCKHLCRHCPIVPVYKGRFRVVQQDVVLADIRQQVAAGARHITFGDPDFLNGPGHAVPIVEALHREFPTLTYDVTIKVEHLLKHDQLVPLLKQTGCRMVTTAVESVDDRILEIFDKGHTCRDFERVVELFDENRLSLNPTFIPFTPWTTSESFAGFLKKIDDLNLVENVASVQLAIRLLIPSGSRLLEVPGVEILAGSFDKAAMVHPWRFLESETEDLFQRVRKVVGMGTARQQSRRQVFSDVWEAAERMTGDLLQKSPKMVSRASVPYLTEPWYC